MEKHTQRERARARSSWVDIERRTQCCIPLEWVPECASLSSPHHESISKEDGIGVVHWSEHCFVCGCVHGDRIRWRGKFPIRRRHVRVGGVCGCRCAHFSSLAPLLSVELSLLLSLSLPYLCIFAHLMCSSCFSSPFSIYLRLLSHTASQMSRRRCGNKRFVILVYFKRTAKSERDASPKYTESKRTAVKNSVTRRDSRKSKRDEGGG